MWRLCRDGVMDQIERLMLVASGDELGSMRTSAAAQVLHRICTCTQPLVICAAGWSACCAHALFAAQLVSPAASTIEQTPAAAAVSDDDTDATAIQ